MLRKRDGAERKGLGQFRVIAAPDDEFRRASADVHDQALLLAPGQRVRTAEINQTRLFGAGDDVDWQSEGLFGPLQQRLPIACDAVGAGCDGADPLAGDGEIFEWGATSRAAVQSGL